MKTELVVEHTRKSFRICIAGNGVRVPFTDSYKENVKNSIKATAALERHSGKTVEKPNIVLLSLFSQYVRVLHPELHEKFSHLTTSNTFEIDYQNNLTYLKRRLAIVDSYQFPKLINKLKDLHDLYIVYLTYAHRYFS